nr:EAL domain-containing protein [Lachnospiraceae bacterium]
VHPEQICFTFTEIGDRDSGDGLMDNIKKLSLQGYGIALDGYGNGKLNLNIRRISGISIKFVRLDKILIDEMHKEGGKEVLSETISVLKSVPFSVVAPGVDDEKTKVELLEMGCDLMMGDLFTIDDDYVSV